MLVPTMTNREVTQEIDRDFEIITNSSTLLRLMYEYDKERKKNKVRKEEDYTIFKEFKTNSKNKWITRISKRRSVKRYNGIDDIVTTCFTYYYSKIGIRVFFRTESGIISVFNGHMLTRYRERLNLGQIETMDIFMRFFTINKELNYQILPRENEEQKFIGIVKEGFILGHVYIEGEDRVWFVHKTFIDCQTAKLSLNSTANELIKLMENNLVKANHQNDEELYADLLKLYNDFGLMENKEYNAEISARMKEIVSEVRKNNMPETEFWMIS